MEIDFAVFKNDKTLRWLNCSILSSSLTSAAMAFDSSMALLIKFTLDFLYGFDYNTVLKNSGFNENITYIPSPPKRQTRKRHLFGSIPLTVIK